MTLAEILATTIFSVKLMHDCIEYKMLIYRSCFYVGLVIGK